MSTPTQAQPAQARTNTTIAAVLFDLDGTLLDTAPDFVRILNQLRQEANLPALPYGEIRTVVSNGARALIERGFGAPSNSTEEALFQSRLERLLALYKQGIADESRLFEGMEQLLGWLEAQNLPWGIVTNKPLEYSAPLLSELALDKRCATLICPDHVTHRKPHPEPLLLACRQLGVEPSESLYVGDHERDIESGRRAGMTTAAALYGYLEPGCDASSWGSDFQVQTPDELLQLLIQRHSG